MFRVIVAGGRNFNNYQLLVSRLNHLLKDKKKEDIQIVSGTAPGADIHGERYAHENGYQLVLFPAKWEDLTAPGAIIKIRRDGKRYNSKAGIDRNLLMAQNADAAVVFWDGKSTGSKNMIDTAKKLKLSVRIVKY